MALDVNKLKTELLKIIDPNDAHFVGYPTNATDFANNWANAYDTYAQDAQDVSGDVLITAFKTAMATKLMALNVPAGVIATAASTFDDALKAYWASAVFAVGIVPTLASACPSVGGTGTWATETSSVGVGFTAGILEASLLSLLAIPSSDPQVKAPALAAAFHNATTTAVKILITGVDTTAPTPLPITNTCGVF